MHVACQFVLVRKVFCGVVHAHAKAGCAVQPPFFLVSTGAYKLWSTLNDMDAVL